MSNYVDFFNDYVKKWYEIATSQLEQFHLWDDFFDNKPFSFLNSLPFRYFPEPYIGNPKSKKLKAVFINLNPGEGGVMQDVFKSPNSLSILDVFESNDMDYQKTIKSFIDSNEKFFDNNYFDKNKPLKNQLKKYKEENPTCQELKPLHDTYVWWHDNRLLWLKDILGIDDLQNLPSLNDIVGIELTPWHSTNFSEMVNTAKANNIWQYVLKPCIEFSKNIEEGCFKRGKKSIVIAKGSVLKKILSEKNLKILSNEFEELKDSNPIKPLQNYTNWYQWVYKCKDPEWTCFFLVYSKPGYDMKIAQSPEVIEIFKQILSDEYSC